MNRYLPALAIALLASMTSWGLAAPVTGYYMETRTCQVYTGPCFANAEVGIAGREAIMAWQIKSGELDGQNLAGLKAVVVDSLTKRHWDSAAWTRRANCGRSCPAGRKGERGLSEKRC